MTFLKPCEITQVRQATLSTSSLPRALWEQGDTSLVSSVRAGKRGTNEPES